MNLQAIVFSCFAILYSEVRRVKKWKIFLLLPLFLLTGCQKGEPAKPRVVEQIQVRCGDLTRVYTQDDKMRRILCCLRQLELAGYPGCDPERQAGNEVRVELRFSDGSCSIWYQRCGSYVSRDLHRWRQLRREDNSLRYLLYLMGSDTVANGEKN